MYNYELVSSSLFKQVFNISDPLTVLEDRNILLSCYRHLSYQINNVEPYDSSYKLKTDLIENYLLTLLSKKVRTKREEDIINSYRNVLVKLINNFSQDAVISSKLYKYYYLLLTKEDAKKCAERLVYISKKAFNIYQKYLSGQQVVSKDMNYLFEFLTNNVDSENKLIVEMCEHFTKKLYTTNINASIYYKNFVLHYLMHKFCAENIYSDVPIYMSNKFALDGRQGKYNAITSYPFKIINFNLDFINQDYNSLDPRTNVLNGVRILKTLFHELQHVRQFNEFKNDVTMDSTVFNVVKSKILDEYLSNEKDSEYNVNYQYREIEREADTFGWVKTYSTLLEYAPNRTIEIEQIKRNAVVTLYEQSVALQKDLVKNRLFEIDNYNVTKLTEIIKEHPELIKEYPHLELFFNDNGDRKNLKELLITYCDIEKNNYLFENYDVDIEVFNEFFKIVINDTGIYKFFPLNMKEEYQITWFTMVFHLLKKERESIKHMKYVAGSISSGKLKYFCESRRKYMLMFKNYLLENYNAILHLKNYTEFHKKEFDTLTETEINTVYEDGIEDIDSILSSLKTNEKGFSR